MRLNAGRGLLWTFAGICGAFMLLPVIVVVPVAFSSTASFAFPPAGWSLQWFAELWSDPYWLSSLLTSLTVGIAVCALATTLGTAAAYGIYRLRRRPRVAALIQAALLLPLVVPVMIFAVGTYGLYLRWQLTGSLFGFVLAHTVLALPFVLVTVSSALAAFDPSMERAAATLGASAWRTFFRVVVPSIAKGIATGAVFAFVASFDELVVSLFLKSAVTTTLPVQIYSSVTRETDPTAAAAATLIIIIATLIAATYGALVQRRTRTP